MSVVCGSEERALLPTETLFQYRGREKYISMQEFVKTSPTEEELHSHSILDEQLSIIKKQKERIVLPLPPAEAPQEAAVNYLIREIDAPVLYHKAYLKYCQLDDFVFGRESWGRTVNSLRISSDLISRLHARLTGNSLQRQQVRRKTMEAVKEVVNSSHYSSLLRKVPSGIWARVLQYAEEPQIYRLRDCGSRNGTFLMDCGMESAKVEPGEGYQFESRDYIIYVNLVLREKGSSLATRLAAFMENWKSQEFYNYRYPIKVIYSPGLQQTLSNRQDAISAIYFEVVFSHDLKYHFWLLTDLHSGAYPLGGGQMVSISPNPNQPEETGRHGVLQLREGEWWLHAGYQGERVWVKLPAERDYGLQLNRRYRIRLGHVHLVELTFLNFS